MNRIYQLLRGLLIWLVLQLFVTGVIITSIVNQTIEGTYKCEKETIPVFIGGVLTATLPLLIVLDTPELVRSYCEGKLVAE